MDIDDGITVPLTTLACNVYLRTHQVEDPELASARQMLGRAAVLIGRLEDAIVFNGQPVPGAVAAGVAPRPAVYSIQGGPQQGLLNCPPPAIRVLGPGFGNDLVNHKTYVIASDLSPANMARLAHAAIDSGSE